MNKTTALWGFAALLGVLMAGPAAADSPLVDPWNDPPAKRNPAPTDDPGVIDPWQDDAPTVQPTRSPRATNPSATNPSDEAPPPSSTADIQLNISAVGLSAQSLSPALRRFFGVPQQAGVLISRVDKGAAAATAGLRVGDVVVAVGNSRVDLPDELQRLLEGHRPGDQVSLSVVRARRPITVTFSFPGADPTAYTRARAQQLRNLRLDMAQLRQRMNQLERRLEQLEATGGTGGPRLSSRQ